MDALVEPHDDLDVASRLREELLVRGVLPTDADRYGAYLLGGESPTWWPNGALQNRLPLTTRLEEFCRLAGRVYRDTSSENDARFALMAALVERGVILDERGAPMFDTSPAGRLTQPAVLRHLLPHFLRWGLDLRPALARGSSPEWLAELLFADSATRTLLRPKDYLDFDRLREWDRFATRSSGGAKGPGEIGFWFRTRGGEALADLLQVAEVDVLEEHLGRFAGAVLQEFAHPISWRASPPISSLDDRVGEFLLGWCDLLAKRAGVRGSDLDLLGTYFEVVLLLDRRTPGRVPEPQRATAARIAGKALGQLRRAAHEAGPGALGVESPAGRLAYSNALGTLAVCGGLAEVIKAGVLLLRALPEPAVSADLRWWNEEPLEVAPPKWSWLVSTLVALVHSRGGVEQAADPELREARSALARFLLDRLKPRRDLEATEDRLEPDARWRRCCIRAVRELAVNPDGRGHRTLHHAADGDPDEAVRASAREGYDEVRRSDGSTGDVSPRRRLVAALWWLRQAHRLALGLDVDAAGARRTRQREISLTTETTATTK